MSDIIVKVPTDKAGHAIRGLEYALQDLPYGSWAAIELREIKQQLETTLADWNLSADPVCPRCKAQTGGGRRCQWCDSPVLHEVGDYER